MIKIKFCIYFAIIWCVSVPLSSKGQNNYKIVKGIVLDQQKQPLSFASVFVKHTSIGTITNENGEYIINIPADHDSLTVSYIGYSNSTQQIKSELNSQVFFLHKTTTTINEIIVSEFSAKETIKEAINKIPENYPQEPVLLNYFYREILFENDSLEYVGEASYEVIRSYKKNRDDKFYIKKNRSFRFNNDTSTNITLIAGQSWDYIKNVDKFLNRRVLERHSFKYNGSTKLNGREVYIISISPKRRYKGNGTSGSLYIDMETLAFLRVELEFHYKDPNKYNNLLKRYNCQYAMNGQYCTPVTTSMVSEKWFKINRKSYKANAYSTAVITDVKDGLNYKIKNLKFNEENSLEFYPDNYDTAFWKDINHILPDKKTSQKLNSYKKTDKPEKTRMSQKDDIKNKNVRDLYHPNIELYFSSHTPNNMQTFASSHQSINSLIQYNILRNKNVNRYSGLIVPIYFMGLALPYQFAEVEKMLLNIKGVNAKYRPFLFNKYTTSHCFNIENEALEKLKTESLKDYLRLHTIRKDVNYTSTNQLEEKIACAQWDNDKKVRNDYFRSYYFELFVRKFAYSVSILSNFDLTGFDPDKKHDELELPTIIDKKKSFVHYLFNPTDSLNRFISSSDLTKSERRYNTRSDILSFINWVSPQMFAMKPFKLSRNSDFSFSLGYLLTPFGEMFEQKFWFISKEDILGLSLRQYKNHNMLGIGIGLKMYDYKINKKLKVNTTIDYWYQPENLSFYDTKFNHGFGVRQKLIFNLREDKINHDGDINIFCGYDLKTKGYQPHNLMLDNDVSVFIGLQYNLKK